MQFSCFNKVSSSGPSEEVRKRAIDNYNRRKYAPEKTPEQEAKETVQSIYEEFLKEIPAAFKRAG